jgi:CRP-like cAMP-binding protein
VDLDFGILSRKRLESGAYRQRKKSVGEAEFTKSMIGMTPSDYGGALALALNELLTSVERLGGKKYAWRALAYGYDKLDWELQEITEDYLLKYVPYASGLSNKLSEERDDVGLLLRSVPLFTGMSEAMIRALSRKVQSCHYRAGEKIGRAAEADDSFYIVRAGRLEMIATVDFEGDRYHSRDSSIEKDHARLFSKKTLTRGDYFDGSALLQGKSSKASVHALIPAEVLRLNKADFDRLIDNSLHFDENTPQEIRRLGLLRQIPLFESFDGRLLKSIVRKLEEVKFQAGDPVFRQGDPADKFYIIERGKVGVIIDEEPRATLGTGEYFGEIALLLNTPRTATMIAIQPLELLQLRAHDFNELLQDSSAMRQALERISSRRMLANGRWARQRRATPSLRV